MKVSEFNKLKEILVGNGIETVFEIYGNGQFKLHISFKNFGRNIQLHLTKFLKRLSF